MYRLLMLVCVSVASCTGGQHENDDVSTPESDSTILTQTLPLETDTTNQEFKLNDTLFIQRELTTDFYHAIFIESNSQSEDYKRLLNFTFEKYGQRSFTSIYKAILAIDPEAFKNFDLLELSRKWLPLYAYKDKFYLYAPSDWGSAGRQMITDSALISWDMDGPSPEPLRSVEKASDSKYIITSTNPLRPNSELTQLTIHIIDTDTKMAVWQYSYGPNDHWYQLYVPVDNATEFNMIVNYCVNQKQMEFEFDKIDYNALLNNR